MTKDASKINDAYKILIAPLITESATMMAEANKYVFKVFKSADKGKIKESIEALYKVTVLNVRTINIPSKKRMRGRIEGRRGGFKKAIVTLKQGDSINIFEEK